MAAARGQQPMAPPWCGATTPDSVVVTVPLDQAGVTARLAVSTAANLGSPVYSAPVVSQAAAGNAVRLTLSGSRLDTATGLTTSDPAVKARLLPASGPGSREAELDIPTAAAVGPRSEKRGSAFVSGSHTGGCRKRWRKASASRWCAATEGR